ncbi:hypothetical protein J6590_030723 [Homalodisca vitripennis]|nr:hypothetical protein J6590_030723 [Homalodisca vitripennis]
MAVTPDPEWCRMTAKHPPLHRFGLVTSASRAALSLSCTVLDFSLEYWLDLKHTGNVRAKTSY